ncbi:uncharacterized protein ACIBXB_020785 isoform 3-T8 [Morphnus guianensis]
MPHLDTKVAILEEFLRTVQFLPQRELHSLIDDMSPYISDKSLSPDITVLVVQHMAHLITLYPVGIWSSDYIGAGGQIPSLERDFLQSTEP